MKITEPKYIIHFLKECPTVVSR